MIEYICQWCEFRTPRKDAADTHITEKAHSLRTVGVADVPAPACPLCGLAVPDEEYGDHVKECRAAQARAGREKVLAKIKELFPEEYAKAEREVTAERSKTKKGGGS